MRVVVATNRILRVCEIKPGNPFLDSNSYQDYYIRIDDSKLDGVKFLKGGFACLCVKDGVIRFFGGDHPVVPLPNAELHV